MSATEKRFVLLGAGFWARYQLAAWGEQSGVVCVGIVDRDRLRAEALAATVGAAAFTDAAEALDTLQPDFVDMVTPVETHAPLADLCRERHIPVICQKPLATTPEETERLVDSFTAAGVPLLVHENWRWQTPLRTAAIALKSGRIGTPFRARITFACSFPVFTNQPFLAMLPRFIITDIGSHVLDVARLLFGEARSVYAQTRRANPGIAGEDVATVMMSMGEAETTVTVEMSYASRTEYERFPQTYLFVEGTDGSLEIGPDYLLHITDTNGTLRTRHTPPRFAWADPAYDLVQASIVACQFDLLAHLRGERIAETTGIDNRETARLVFAAYESAETGAVLHLGEK